jgi:hypothetical protein
VNSHRHPILLRQDAVLQHAGEAVQHCVMQRFKQNDAVCILPKFARMYPNNSAVVIGVTADPFRSMFNTYTLEFADGSTAKLFDFQIIDDIPNYQTLVASLAFDSSHPTATAQTRGSSSGRRIVLQTPAFDLDMKIRMDKWCAVIMGQVLERGTNSLLKNIEIRVLKEGVPVRMTIADSIGVFKFGDVPRGSLDILVTIPQYLSRILATFSI